MAKTSPSKLEIKELCEVGVVVKDLQKTIENYWNILGIGPWEIYTFKPPLTSGVTYRGKSSQHTAKIAIAWMGQLMLEVIQPLEGDSIFKETLDKYGEGFMQFCFPVENMDETVRVMEKKGIACLERGYFGTIGFAFFDTVGPLKVLWEPACFPKGYESMPVPEARWPE